jgi:hypothetical protein
MFVLLQGPAARAVAGLRTAAAIQGAGCNPRFEARNRLGPPSAKAGGQFEISVGQSGSVGLAGAGQGGGDVTDVTSPL